MDCYSSRKNMNAGRPRYVGKAPGAPAPDFQPVSPAQPVFKQQTVEAASCGCGTMPPFTVPVNPPMGGSCPVMPQMPEPRPVMPQMPGTSPIMPQMSGPGPVLPPANASCTNTAPGCLEQNYSIAMAYVPWQQWQGVYSMEQGFKQGTIFPELDLPFEPRRCRL